MHPIGQNSLFIYPHFGIDFVQYISLSPFAPDISSLETDSAVPSRISLNISILRLNLMLTYGVPPEFHDGVHLFI